MIGPTEDRLGPMTPQLARRVALIGTFALAMFAIIFFRLWFLQVLSGDQYANAAQRNITRHIAIAAPRGEILASNGTTLVDSTPVNAVQLLPDSLPTPVSQYAILHGEAQPADDVALYKRLARVVGIRMRPIACEVVTDRYSTKLAEWLQITAKRRLDAISCAVAQQVAQQAFAPVSVAVNVSTDVVAYLQERQSEFHGVVAGRVFLQQYPRGDQAAQVLGTVGPISCVSAADCETSDPRFKGVSHQAIVGQSGLEWQYDQYLRGQDGYQTVKVNALGEFEGYEGSHAPTAGDNLRTSLNLPLQEAGQAALQQSIAQNPPSTGGAFVALNPETGEVYAMGSAPTFNPSIFTQPFLPQSEYDALTNPASNYPLDNRAIASVGPTGSTFKPITATAALESGAWSVNQTFDDTGQFCISGECRHNAGHAVDGVLNLQQALMVSSDDFFYNLGARTNVTNPLTQPQGGALQEWAKSFGIGRPTGIDLPGEASGTRPTPAWRAHLNYLEAQCIQRKGQYKSYPKGKPCDIAILPPEPWTIGDNENMAVGQGDVQASPLQLAVAYSAIANGGTVVRPHIGLDIESPNGTVLQKLPTPPGRNIHIDPYYLDTIRAGLRDAASLPGGTSYQVFQNFPQQVYGKTGTAQYDGQQDYSWYACFVPASATTKPIVIVVWVEQGGFGAVAAAPVAREMLSQWFYGHRGPYVAGNSQTL